MEKIKIMIADDHPAFRDGLSQLLKEETDLEVVAICGDGEEAVRLALQLKPGVIIMDISMVGMNGIEATRRIKVNVPETAVLIVSAYNYQSYILGALRAGAAGYLTKAASLSELKKAIRLAYSGKCVFDMKVTGRLIRKLAGDKMASRPVEELYPRELEVLNSAARGMSNRQIACTLELSERTVQTHLMNVFRKLSVSSRTEAVLQALRTGWLTIDDLPDLQEENG